MIRGMRLDEEAPDTVYDALPHGAVNGSPIPGDPQIVISLLQPVNLVVPHAVVLGQNRFDPMDAILQFSAEPVDHIPQPANLCGGGAFRTDLNDVHEGQ